MRHVFGFDEGVELFTGKEAEFECGLAERSVFMVSGVGDFGSVIVADFGSERCDEHERIFHVVVDDVAIDFNANDAVIHERVAGVGEQFHGMKVVENNHGLEDI